MVLFYILCIFKMFETAAEPEMAHSYYQMGRQNIICMSTLDIIMIGKYFCSVNKYNFVLGTVCECAR